MLTAAPSLLVYCWSPPPPSSARRSYLTTVQTDYRRLAVTQRNITPHRHYALWLWWPSWSASHDTLSPLIFGRHACNLRQCEAHPPPSTHRRTEEHHTTPPTTMHCGGGLPPRVWNAPTPQVAAERYHTTPPPTIPCIVVMAEVLRRVLDNEIYIYYQLVGVGWWVRVVESSVMS